MGDRAKPRLLDLFCGAGGASVGYHRAGFDVTGVDIALQPHYPFPFVQADVLEISFAAFDVIHASPPCQKYMRSGNVDRDRHPDLLPTIRDRLKAIGVPFVIENVPGAPMRPDVILCGSVFGLAVRRHRWFESNIGLAPWRLACNHSTPIAGVYGHAHGAGGANAGMLPGSLASWSTAMGIDWMTTGELREAIPPAYTEWIGERLLEALG